MGVLSCERYQLSLENVERVWTRQLFFWPAAGAYRPRGDVAEHFECPAYNPKKDKAYYSREQCASTSCRTHLRENHRALRMVNTYMGEKHWNPRHTGCVQRDAALQYCQSCCSEIQCMWGSCPLCALSNSGTSNWLHKARAISLCIPAVFPDVRKAAVYLKLEEGGGRKKLCAVQLFYTRHRMWLYSIEKSALWTQLWLTDVPASL